MYRKNMRAENYKILINSLQLLREYDRLQKNLRVLRVKKNWLADKYSFDGVKGKFQNYRTTLS